VPVVGTWVIGEALGVVVGAGVLPGVGVGVTQEQLLCV